MEKFKKIKITLIAAVTLLPALALAASALNTTTTEQRLISQEENYITHIETEAEAEDMLTARSQNSFNNFPNLATEVKPHTLPDTTNSKSSTKK